MSKENVELFRRAIKDYNRRDIEAMLAIWHPDAEWYPFTAQVEGDDAYHGHEGLRRWWANVDATFEEIEASVEEVRDLGDSVLALGRLRARFRSGVTLDSEIGWPTRYRDGLGVWGRAYQSHAEALEAAGLWSRHGPRKSRFGREAALQMERGGAGLTRVAPGRRRPGACRRADP